MKNGRLPPGTGKLDRFKVNRAGQQEAIWQPLYDYLTYASVGQTELSFFANPIGQGATSHPGSTGPKTRADTNMDLAGTLPSPQRFLVTSLEVLFWPAEAIASTNDGDAGTQFNDVSDVLSSGYLSMRIGSKEYINDGPLQVFPPTTRLAGSAALADTTTPGANQLRHINYATGAGQVYEISPFYIPSNQNFSVKLVWPNAVPITADARIGVRLNGFLYRLSQ